MNRDLVFVCIGLFFLTIMYHVETSSTRNDGEREILDIGFEHTTKLHAVLDRNPSLNDACAGANSIFLSVMMIYPLWMTFIKGDFSLAFRMGATLAFRAFCGWCTYLPSPPSFLPSSYDMPEIFHCVLGPYVNMDFGDECQADEGADALPFVTFFSGHTAIVVIVANDMWKRKWSYTSVLLHALNFLQMIRLLATRGHYSIDIIIGWVVAIYVSSPAARIGRKFSTLRSVSELVEGLRDKATKRPRQLFLRAESSASLKSPRKRK